jgi:hypothetical protein
LHLTNRPDSFGKLLAFHRLLSTKSAKNRDYFYRNNGTAPVGVGTADLASYEALLRFETAAAAETNPELQKGEIQWTFTTIPLAKRLTDSQKVELPLQRA